MVFHCRFECKSDTHGFPFLLHLLHGFLQGVLLASRLGDALELGDERLDVHVDELGQVHVLVRFEREAHDV